LLNCRGAEPEDDRRRRALVDRLHVIRDVRNDLRAAAAAGRHAESASDRWI
jgi:hypothetical protein